MEVFISWSGDLSHSVALALRDWLPSVIQSLTPYVSSEDIDKGARWNSDISQELADSSYGILCVTPDNIEAPWMNFEAGALSKSLERSRVAPFLVRMKRTDLQGPLLQFQSTIYEKGDVFKLLCSLNKACAEAGLDEAKLAEVFGVWWPYLKERLDKLVSAPVDAVGHPRRSTEDLVTEILELVRGQQVLLRSPEAILPPQYLAELLRVRSDERSLQPDIPVGVFLDLERAWGRLRDYVESHPQEGPDLKAVLEEFSAPMRFLLRSRNARLHEGRRVREIEEVRRQWEVDQELLRAEDRQRAEAAQARLIMEVEAERRRAESEARKPGDAGRSGTKS